MTGPKLSPDVQSLLEWLKAGHYIEICTEPCRAIGEIICSAAAPVHSPKATLFTLLQNSQLTKTEYSIYGIRWARFSYSHSGQSAAQNREFEHG